MPETGTIRMSRKERDSLVVFERVKKGEMRLVDAAEVLSIIRLIKRASSIAANQTFGIACVLRMLL